MADLTSLANVKEFLGITSADYDALLDSLITRMSAFVENYCKRIFAITAYTELHDGTVENGGVVILRNYPITTFTSLHDDTSRTYDASTLVAAADYVTYDEEGIVQLVDGIQFNIDLQNIQVIYSAGFAATPADLEQSVIELVSIKFTNRGKEALKSEKLGRWAATYLSDSSTLSFPGLGQVQISASVTEVLERYKIRRFYVV